MTFRWRFRVSPHGESWLSGFTPSCMGTSQVEKNLFAKYAQSSNWIMKPQKNRGENLRNIWNHQLEKDWFDQSRFIHIWFGSFQLACTQDSSHQLQDETYLGSGVPSVHLFKGFCLQMHLNWTRIAGTVPLPVSPSCISSNLKWTCLAIELDKGRSQIFLLTVLLFSQLSSILTSVSPSIHSIVNP